MKDFFNKVLNKFKEMDTKKQILVLIGVFVAFIGYLYVVGLIAQRKTLIWSGCIVAGLYRIIK